MEKVCDYLDQKNIPYVRDEKFVFACGFVFYKFEEKLACNNPVGNQHLNLSISDVEKLLKRQLRKVPISVNKPFWRQISRPTNTLN